MSEPISELVRAYTAEIASLRNMLEQVSSRNVTLQVEAETKDALIATLLYENTGLKCQVDESNEHALALQHEVYHYLAALEEIREFAAGALYGDHPAVYHSLTVDIPAMCDMALPLPESSEPVSADESIPF